MKFETVHNVPIKSWVDLSEYNELLKSQTENIASLPSTFSHVALMPDAHGGFGMPIGGVLTTKGVVVPGAVGFDSGCGMLAAKLNLKADDFVSRDSRVEMGNLIRSVIPVGLGGHNVDDNVANAYMQIGLKAEDYLVDDVYDLVKNNINSQLGTLGSGNHFQEFGIDPVTGDVWLVIHSGSRGVGYKIAEHYIKKAQELEYNIVNDINKELVGLPLDTDLATEYIRALQYSLEWARNNRLVMLDNVVNAIGAEVLENIDCHHNEASYELHFDETVWVHRKGATNASLGKKVIIPGNMGQGTIIGTGMGNPDSFNSCSHGAGRKMGRNEAKRTLDLAEQREKLNKLDVILSAGADGALDEMPDAYKDFDMVMDNQKDLVSVDIKIKPLLVIKG